MDFVYADDCPHVARTRAHLEQALTAAGLPPRWREHRAGHAETPPELRGYGSPSVLVDGRDIGGLEPGSPDCCRLYDGEGAPPVALIVRALREGR